jgi:hypothetical protein
MFIKSKNNVIIAPQKMSPHYDILLFVGMCIAVAVLYIKLRESAREVGANVFETTSIETGRGTRCELVDCTHNVDARLTFRALRVGSMKNFTPMEKIETREGVCSIGSRAEPLLDIMDFYGYCHEYDGERYPFVRDERRKGMTRWDRFIKREPFWLRGRGGPFEFNDVEIGRPGVSPGIGWVFTKKQEEIYEEILEQAEAEARMKIKASAEKDKRAG